MRKMQDTLACAIVDKDDLVQIGQNFHRADKSLDPMFKSSYDRVISTCQGCCATSVPNVTGCARRVVFQKLGPNGIRVKPNCY